MVKPGKKEIGKYLGDFYAQRQSLFITVDELIKKIKQLGVFYFGADTFLHQAMMNMREEMMGVKLHIIIRSLIVLHVLAHQINKIMRTAPFDTRATTADEGVTQERLDVKARRPLDNMVFNRQLADGSCLAVMDDFILVGGSAPRPGTVSGQQAGQMNGQVGLELADGRPGTLVLGESVVGKFKIPPGFNQREMYPLRFIQCLFPVS